METMKTTILGNSYWNNNGVYQTEYDKLYNEHVPVNGNAKTLNGELIRAISRLFYEYCNNGNCNAGDIVYETEELDCSYCNGTGVVEDGDEEIDCCYCYGDGFTEEEFISDTYITDMYENFLKLIQENVTSLNDNKVLNKVRDIILSNSVEYFSDMNMDYYNRMCDNVIYYVLNNDDKNLPSWYLMTSNCK